MQSKKGQKGKKPIASFPYLIRPRDIIKSPMQQYNLAQMETIVNQHDQITDHFNYGFNIHTFPAYARYCKRLAEYQSLSHSNLSYNSNSHSQVKFNDENPMDLGGFGPFLDQQVEKVWQKDVSSKDTLMNYFVYFNFCSTLLKQKNTQNQPSLTSFLQLITQPKRDEDDYAGRMVDQMVEKIEQKFNLVMETLTKNSRNGNEKKIDKEEPTAEQYSSNPYESIFSNLKKQKGQAYNFKQGNKYEQEQDKSIEYSSISGFSDRARSNETKRQQYSLQFASEDYNSNINFRRDGNNKTAKQQFNRSFSEEKSVKIKSLSIYSQDKQELQDSHNLTQSRKQSQKKRCTSTRTSQQIFSSKIKVTSGQHNNKCKNQQERQRQKDKQHRQKSKTQDRQKERHPSIKRNSKDYSESSSSSQSQGQSSELQRSSSSSSQHSYSARKKKKTKKVKKHSHRKSKKSKKSRGHKKSKRAKKGRR